MKHKITFFAIVMMAMAIQHNVFAYDFSDVAPSGQTLYYKIVNDHAEVVHPGSGSYVSGDLVIPSSVTYNGYTYPVTPLT